MKHRPHGHGNPGGAPAPKPKPKPWVAVKLDFHGFEEKHLWDGPFSLLAGRGACLWAEAPSDAWQALEPLHTSLKCDHCSARSHRKGGALVPLKLG